MPTKILADKYKYMPSKYNLFPVGTGGDRFGQDMSWVIASVTSTTGPTPAHH